MLSHSCPTSDSTSRRWPQNWQNRFCHLCPLATFDSCTDAEDHLELLVHGVWSEVLRVTLVSLRFMSVPVVDATRPDPDVNDHGCSPFSKIWIKLLGKSMTCSESVLGRLSSRCSYSSPTLGSFQDKGALISFTCLKSLDFPWGQSPSITQKTIPNSVASLCFESCGRGWVVFLTSDVFPNWNSSEPT